MYQNKHTQTKKTSKKVLLVLAIIVVFVVAGFTALHFRNQKNTTADKTSAGTASKIDYSPATEEEKAQSDDVKDQQVDKQNNPPATSSAAQPVITRAVYGDNGLEVDSYVSGVIEDDGTCTMTATNGSQTVTKTTTAVANVSNTACPSFTASKTELSTKGTWTIKVAYSSIKASGTSAATIVTVP